MPERIHKIIAHSGLMSRRSAEQAISEGRVHLNGSLVTEFGSQANPRIDLIEVDGRQIKVPEEKTFILLNKPRGFVTTKADPFGRKTVMDLLGDQYSFLNPIGRLDYDSEGLLVFTNNGEMANQLMHPSYGVGKIYHAWVRGSVDDEKLKALTTRIDLEEAPAKFADAEVIEQDGNHTCLEITVKEGRNRFIRRMMGKVGNPVTRLKRIRVGPLKLGLLPLGKYKVLSKNEVENLRLWLIAGGD